MFYRTEEESITAQLEQLETAGGRQLGVATVASLEGHDVGDYGYRLGRAWGIGGKEANDGVVFLIAPNDRRMNISVGYGLEPILTDALSRSEERRVGKGWVSTCRSRLSPDH